MGVYAAYEICVDLTGDRDFADTNEDISAYVKELEWQHGAEAPYTDIARASTLTMILSNTTQRFSPEHASALTGFEPGAIVRVRVTDPTTTTVHPQFLGRIDQDGIRPSTDANGARVCEVRASGVLMQLLDEVVSIDIQVDQRADEIIDAILSAAAIYPPGLTGVWLLGHSGMGELGQTTTLATGTSDYASLETGVNTFGYAGDNWKAGTTVHRALRDVVATERGFLYENRQGKLVFYNRHHWHTDLANAVDATLTEDMIWRRGGMEYVYGNLANRAVVKFHPRAVGTQAEVLADGGDPILVAAGTSETITLQFVDSETGSKVGGMDVLTPVAVVDYTANSAPGGGGTNLTGSVTISLVATAKNATLTIVNGAAVDAYVRNLQVRGTKITDYGEIEVRYEDASSIQEYGRADSVLSLPLLDDATYARDLARWEVMLHKDPTGETRWIAMLANRSSTIMTHVLARGIGTRIALSETQTGMSDQNYVIGERHHVVPGQIHDVVHFLQPAPPATAWILGVAGFGELGQTTYLGL